jgi:hypothetical protein
MIKYNKRISLDQKRDGFFRLESDRGDVFETATSPGGKNSVTNWWNNQFKNELREWQKDICIGYFWDIFGPLNLFYIYKKGQGYTQSHDMCLVQIPGKFWIFATQEDCWIKEPDGAHMIFDRSESLGSLLDPNVRLKIGQFVDQLKTEFNPANEVHV